MIVLSLCQSGAVSNTSLHTLVIIITIFLTVITTIPFKKYTKHLLKITSNNLYETYFHHLNKFNPHVLQRICTR